MRSVIDYALPVYYHNLTVSDKRRLDQLQYKAAKLTTGALHYTSAEKLNIELGWENIKTRANCLGLSIFHKIVTGATRPLIKTCLPEFLPVIDHNIRQRKIFKHILGNVSFLKPFFPYFSKKWENLPHTVRCNQQDDFKKQIKLSLQPKRYKFLARGHKIGNKLLTQIRVGRSYLGAHSFAISLADSPSCECNFRSESPTHYFLDCPLYTEERRTMPGIL